MSAWRKPGRAGVSRGKGMQVIEAVFWDIDGTLVESEPAHARALERVGVDMGYRLQPGDMARYQGWAMDLVFADLKRRHDLSQTYEVWIEALTQAFVREIAEAPVRPGVGPSIAALAARAVPQAAVSNATPGIVAANLARVRERAHLRFALSMDDVPRPKPHPDPYLAAAARLGVKPARSVVIEDSPKGVAAGKAAGAFTIAVPLQGASPIDPDAPDRLFGSLDDIDWDEIAHAVGARKGAPSGG